MRVRESPRKLENATMKEESSNRTCSMCITCGTSSTNSPSSTSRTSSTSSKALAVLTLQNTEVYVCVRQCMCFNGFKMRLQINLLSILRPSISICIASV